MRSMPETDPSPKPLAAKAHRTFANALEAWPLHRPMAVAVLAPVLPVLTCPLQLFALGIAAAGLVQRLNNPSTCPA